MTATEVVEALRRVLAVRVRADRLRALRSLGCRLARSEAEASVGERARRLRGVFRALGQDALAICRDVPALARTLLLSGHERDAEAWLCVLVRALARSRGPAARLLRTVACRMRAELFAEGGDLVRARRWLTRARALLGRIGGAGVASGELRRERLRIREHRLLWGADRSDAERFSAMQGVVDAWLREVERRPGSLRLRRELAGSLLLRAELAIDLRLRGPARRALAACRAIVLALADSESSPLRTGYLLAPLELEEGRMLRWDGELEGAVRVWKSALARLAGAPLCRRREWQRALILFRLGALADHAKDWPASLGHYLDAADALAHVVRGAPRDTAARERHAEALREAAGSAAMAGQRTRSKELFTQALDAAPAAAGGAALRARILRGLSDVTPADAAAPLLVAALGEQATAMLADALSPLALAEALAELGSQRQDADAHALRVAACALSDEVCTEDDSAGLGELVGHTQRLGQGAQSPEQHAEARRWLERAAVRAEAAAEAAHGSGRAFDLELLDGALDHLAWHHAEQHRPVEALEASMRLLGLVRAANARSASHESALASCLVCAAVLCQRVGRPADAAPLLAEAHLRCWRSHRDDPDDLDEGRALGLVLWQRASLAHELGRPALAESLICDAIAVFERYHALLPDHHELRTELVSAHHERFRMTCDPDIERASARAVVALLEPLRARGALEPDLEDIWTQVQGFLRARVRKVVGMG